MNITRRFIPAIFAGGFIGTLTLRWLSLDFLYRLMPEYWSGIGSSIAAVTGLSILISLIILRFLLPIDRISNRIRKTGIMHEDDRDAVIKAYRQTSVAIIIENVIGFIIGQFIVMMLDVRNGVVPYQFSRLAIIMIQATCVGSIAALYELYYLDSLFASCRGLLQIHSMSIFHSVHRHSVASRIMLVTTVTLLFMGINAFSCGYALIHGDNIPEGTAVLGTYLRYGIRCVAITFVECAGLMYSVVYEMKHRLAATREIVSELTTSGDLSRRINISMTDDIGSLISDLNDLMDKLSSMIMSLRTETNSVLTSTGILSTASATSLKALNSMKDFVREIDSEDKNTNGIITGTYRDIQSLKDNAQEVEQQVLVQSEAIERASVSISQLAENITSIAQTAKKADTVSEELRITSGQGSEAIKTAEEAISLIQNAAEEIQGVITMIKKISNQTNLLSMNASIEAAHAGSYGAGFAVVATEVRNLANTSTENAHAIETYMKDMSDKIANGVAAMQKSDEAFVLIGKGIERTADIVRRITLETEEQRSGTTNTLGATKNVVEAIESIKRLASSQREHTDNVYESTKDIVNSSQSISAALKKTMDAVTNLDEAIVSVDHCVSNTTGSVTEMKLHIDGFTTE